MDISSRVLEGLLSRGKLAETGQPLGFGIHAHGSPDWDGRSDRFVQFVDDGLMPLLVPCATAKAEALRTAR